MEKHDSNQIIFFMVMVHMRKLLLKWIKCKVNISTSTSKLAKLRLMRIASASLLEAQYNEIKPTQVDSGHIQCQLQADHSRLYSQMLCLSLRYAKEGAIHCRLSVNCSWTQLQCGLSSLFQVRILHYIWLCYQNPPIKKCTFKLNIAWIRSTCRFSHEHKSV